MQLKNGNNAISDKPVAKIGMHVGLVVQIF